MTRAFTIHTLGPEGTNCEAAAQHWLEGHGYSPDGVVLHETLEDAVLGLRRAPEASAVLACIVYPDLHKLVFRNMRFMAIRECFVVPTHPMVLAARDPETIDDLTTVATHPGPVDLLDDMEVTRVAATSNIAAARMCADGQVDGCITTLPGVRQHDLNLLRDFGPIPMGFSLHAPLATRLGRAPAPRVTAQAV